MSLEEALPPPTKEIIEKVRAEFGLNERSIEEAVESVKDWIRLQPHLPQETDDGRLERWIIRCKNSIEKTKKTLDMYYTLKSHIPELMTDWDTNSNWFQQNKKIYYFIPMPNLTPDGYRVNLSGNFNKDASNHIPEYNFKVTLMSQEVRMNEEYCVSDILIVDMGNYTLAHISKITLPMLKKLQLCGLKGYNMRIKAFHFINVAPYAEFFVNTFKSLFKSKLASRVSVHGTDMSSLHAQVPKNCLPEEFGGTGGTLEENWDRWTKKLESYRDWFLQQEKLKSDDSKRPEGGISTSELFGFEGSFRKLDVD